MLEQFTKTAAVIMVIVSYTVWAYGESSPQNQKHIFFSPGALFIHLDYFGASYWVLKISVVEMSTFS